MLPNSINYLHSKITYNLAIQNNKYLLSLIVSMGQECGNNLVGS